MTADLAALLRGAPLDAARAVRLAVALCDALPGEAGPGAGAGPGTGAGSGTGPARGAGPGPAQGAGMGPAQGAGPGPGRRQGAIDPAAVELVGDVLAGEGRVGRVGDALRGDGGPVDGAAPYVAPEVVQRAAATAAADVYSVGALLYEALTGQPPFRGASPAAVLVKHVLERPKPPRSLRPDVPEAIERVVLAALRKAPAAMAAGAMPTPMAPGAMAPGMMPTPMAPAPMAPGMMPAPMAAGAMPAPMAPGAMPTANRIVAAAPPGSPAAGEAALASSAPPGRRAVFFGLVLVALVLVGVPLLWTMWRASGSAPVASLPSVAPAPTRSESARPHEAPAVPAEPPQASAPPPAPPARMHRTGAPPRPAREMSPSSERKGGVRRAPAPKKDRAKGGRAPAPDLFGEISSAPPGSRGDAAPGSAGGPGAAPPPPLEPSRPPPLEPSRPPPLEPSRPAVVPLPAAPRPLPWLPLLASAAVALVALLAILLLYRELRRQSTAPRPATPQKPTAEATAPQVWSPPLPPVQSAYDSTLRAPDPRAMAYDATVRAPLASFDDESGDLGTATLISAPFAEANDDIEPFLVGQYRCFARLGEGGMGMVYKARHVMLDRLSAVKVLLPQAALQEDAMNLFRREARLASSINHPNSVFIYDYGEVGGQMLYLAMEYIQGSSLADIIEPDQAPRTSLPLPRVLHLTRQICAALTAAHTAGIVHRDLKPANVMVCPRAGSEYVKVVDFGIARSLEVQSTYQTATGAVMGTPAYMSPEQAMGDPDLDARTDVYSLALLVYRMLSGDLPYRQEGKTPVQQIVERALLRDPPPPIRQRRPDLPVGVEAALVHALMPDRSKRTPSAMSFLAELEAAA